MIVELSRSVWWSASRRLSQAQTPFQSQFLCLCCTCHFSMSVFKIIVFKCVIPSLYRFRPFTCSVSNVLSFLSPMTVSIAFGRSKSYVISSLISLSCLRVGNRIDLFQIIVVAEKGRTHVYLCLHSGNTNNRRVLHQPLLYCFFFSF